MFTLLGVPNRNTWFFVAAAAAVDLIETHQKARAGYTEDAKPNVDY